MKDLLDLPYEFQIILVAGYLAYKISTVGRRVNHRTEDFVLQVLAFGLVSRLLAVYPIEWTVALTSPKGPRVGTVDVVDLLEIGSVTVAVGVIFGMFWRRHLNRLSSKVMASLRIYRDDHEASTMASIFSTDAKWSLLQIHCNDGKTYESNLHSIPESVLGRPVTDNEDGISFYLTAIHDSDGKTRPIDWDIPGFGQRITFLSKSRIERIDICRIKD